MSQHSLKPWKMCCLNNFWWKWWWCLAEILSNKNTRYKYVPVIHRMDGFARDWWVVISHWSKSLELDCRNLMKIPIVFYKALFFFFFFAIWSLLIDCGDKIWSLQIIHFYFEVKTYFSLLLLYIWVSPAEINKSLGAENETTPLGSSCLGTWLSSC